MSAIVIIPSRYQSTRFPGKPLSLLLGKPMIQHVYERACKASLVSRVIVATDDTRIADVIRLIGGEAVMTSTRAGAVSVTGRGGRLSGYFTDGDLRRRVQRGPVDLKTPVAAVMTRSPLTVHPDTMAMEAARIIAEKKVDNLPVTEAGTGKPVGIIDERDLLKEGLG